MDPGKEVCDSYASLWHSKKMHTILKKGRMLTFISGCVNTNFQKNSMCFSSWESLAKHQCTLVQCTKVDVKI